MIKCLWLEYALSCVLAESEKLNVLILSYTIGCIVKLEKNQFNIMNLFLGSRTSKGKERYHYRITLLSVSPSAKPIFNMNINKKWEFAIAIQITKKILEMEINIYNTNINVIKL